MNSMKTRKGLILLNKSSELKTTTEIVREVLETQPMTRNSDNHLCYWVYAVIGKRNGIDINSMSMPRFFLHMKDYGFPTTETIRRTRQKLQAAYPELAGSSDVEAMRTVNEGIFRDYARGIV